MSQKTYFPSPRRLPANGVARRPVPSQMAPERCVQREEGIGDTVVLLGLDLRGRVRVKVELASEDVSFWWLKVIRHWLAWSCGACEIKIVG